MLDSEWINIYVAFTDEAIKRRSMTIVNILSYIVVCVYHFFFNEQRIIK